MSHTFSTFATMTSLDISSLGIPSDFRSTHRPLKPSRLAMADITATCFLEYWFGVQPGQISWKDPRNFIFLMPGMQTLFRQGAWILVPTIETLLAMFSLLSHNYHCEDIDDRKSFLDKLNAPSYDYVLVPLDMSLPLGADRAGDITSFHYDRYSKGYPDLAIIASTANPFFAVLHAKAKLKQMPSDFQLQCDWMREILDKIDRICSRQPSISGSSYFLPLRSSSSSEEDPYSEPRRFPESHYTLFPEIQTPPAHERDESEDEEVEEEFDEKYLREWAKFIIAWAEDSAGWCFSDERQVVTRRRIIRYRNERHERRMTAERAGQRPAWLSDSRSGVYYAGRIALWR
ncbi:hypothetical protein C8J56DRAFT_385258 [Mycena floridula]|nr:hypothetical protein C8J56DRAFT_385258 [Mycena floridula]